MPQDQPPSNAVVDAHLAEEVAQHRWRLRLKWLIAVGAAAVAVGLWLLGANVAGLSHVGAIGIFMLGVVLLLLGGDWLVDGSVTIALRLRVPILIVGLTIVAFGTSAPELAFNIMAAMNDNPGLTFGNVIGSNIANLGLVLGLAAVISPIAVASRLVRREIPQLLAVSVLFVVLAYAPPGVLREGAMFPGWNRIHGLVMLAVFVVVTWLWYRGAMSERKDRLAAELEETAVEEASIIPSMPLAIVAIIGGLAALLAGGKLAERGAVGLAEWAGMSNAMIGLTIVALATSLPEVITSVIAAVKGEADLAVGNVVGSNLFNILLVMGLTATIAPVAMPLSTAWIDLTVMIALTALLWPFALTGGRTLSRIEGSALLLAYASYLAFCVLRELR